MHVHPDQIDEGIRIFRQDVLPWLRDSSGFRGWIALVDRENERSIGITFWADEEVARDPEMSGGTLRDAVAEGVGTQSRGTEFFEVVVFESLEVDDGG